MGVEVSNQTKQIYQNRTILWMVHLDDMKQEASFVLLEEYIYANTIIPKLNTIF